MPDQQLKTPTLLLPQPNGSSPARPYQPVQEILLTGRLASEWMNHYPYQRQRPISRKHVDRISYALRMGNMPGDTLFIIAYEKDGSGYLVDGWHRCQAVVETGIQMEGILRCRFDMDMEAIDQEYGLLDQGMIRNTGDTLRAHGVEERWSFTLHRLKRINYAVTLLRDELRTVGRGRGGRTDPSFYDRANTAEAVELWLPTAKLLYDMVEAEPGRPGAKGLLQRSPVLAAALFLTREVPGQGLEFWKDFIRKEEFKKGDVIATLERALLARKGEYAHNPAAAVALVAHAWSAWLVAEPRAKLEMTYRLPGPAFPGTRYHGGLTDPRWRYYQEGEK